LYRLILVCEDEIMCEDTYINILMELT